MGSWDRSGRRYLRRRAGRLDGRQFALVVWFRTILRHPRAWNQEDESHHASSARRTVIRAFLCVSRLPFTWEIIHLYSSAVDLACYTSTARLSTLHPPVNLFVNLFVLICDSALSDFPWAFIDRNLKPALNAVTLTEFCWRTLLASSLQGKRTKLEIDDISEAVKILKLWSSLPHVCVRYWSFLSCNLSRRSWVPSFFKEVI